MIDLEKYVTKEEFIQLQREVREMAESMTSFVKSIDNHMSELVNALSGRVPQGSVPLETHRFIVRGILIVFISTVFAIIGIKHIAPAIFN